MTSDDARVERIARALHDADSFMAWESASDETKDEMRHMARAALAVIDLHVGSLDPPSDDWYLRTTATDGSSSVTYGPDSRWAERMAVQMIHNGSITRVEVGLTPHEEEP